MKKLNTLFHDSQIKQVNELSGVVSKSDIARIALQIGLDSLSKLKQESEGDFYIFTANQVLKGE